MAGLRSPEAGSSMISFKSALRGSPPGFHHEDLSAFRFKSDRAMKSKTGCANKFSNPDSSCAEGQYCTERVRNWPQLPA